MTEHYEFHINPEDPATLYEFLESLVFLEIACEAKRNGLDTLNIGEVFARLGADKELCTYFKDCSFTFTETCDEMEVMLAYAEMEVSTIH
jgi:hypothetical protein